MLINKSKIGYKLLISSILIFSLPAYSCTITMGYRTNERLPLIAESPHNSGLYFDLYSLAAQKIGCLLTVKRLPKKRIKRHIYLGLIDFYPGLNVTNERFDKIVFIKNGLTRWNIGVSRSTMPDVKDIADLQVKLQGKALLVTKGGAVLVNDTTGIKVKTPPETDLAQVLNFLTNKGADFYIYDKASVEYYLKTHSDENIKLHFNCCGGSQPMYAGFSKLSKYVSLKENPQYQLEKSISVTNYPFLLEKSSIAFRFSKALSEIQKTGELKKLYDKYY